MSPIKILGKNSKSAPSATILGKRGRCGVITLFPKAENCRMSIETENRGLHDELLTGYGRASASRNINLRREKRMV
jgi:hypothetical protein